MQSLRAHVKNGRLVLDEPTTLPEGAEVALVVVDHDDLSTEQRTKLHASMAASRAHESLIPSAPFDDLDLDSEEGLTEWHRRLMAMASARIAAARARFERLGIIDAQGGLVSHQLPPDMLPDADTTLETG